MKKRMIVNIAMFCTFVIVGFLIYRSGVIRGFDEEIDRQVEAAEADAYRRNVKEGLIYDGNGDAITDYENRENEERDDETTERGGRVICLYPKAYSWLGHNSDSYGREGFRRIVEDELYTLEGDTGIYLNTINGLQQYCYDKLYDKMGAICVIENNTGKVLAMAGRADPVAEYDINTIDIEGQKAYYDQFDGMYLNQALTLDPPGSVFKMVTAVSMIDGGMSDFIFDDTGRYNDVTNAGMASYGEIGLEEAFTNSVNTYFAAAVDRFGAKQLEKTARRFLIGSSIDLDFGTLNSHFDLENYQSTWLNESTAYGQGKTELTPIHMAMILSSIVNDGVMYKPYVIDRIVHGEKEVMHGEPEIIASEFDSETMSKTRELLQAAAIDYGFDPETYGTVYAKTGTAELDDGSIHTYLVVATDNVTIVLSERKAAGSSYDWIPEAKDILQFISLNIEMESR